MSRPGSGGGGSGMASTPHDGKYRYAVPGRASDSAVTNGAVTNAEVGSHGYRAMGTRGMFSMVRGGGASRGSFRNGGTVTPPTRTPTKSGVLQAPVITARGMLRYVAISVVTFTHLHSFLM